jgi:hypothetical protein
VGWVGRTHGGLGGRRWGVSSSARGGGSAAAPAAGVGRVWTWGRRPAEIDLHLPSAGLGEALLSSAAFLSGEQ